MPPTIGTACRKELQNAPLWLVAPVPDTPTQRYFPQTGHALRGAFLQFWTAHHGALLFGPPISEATYDPGGYAVQYFQNARLEYHPELAGAGYAVEVGLLGRRYLEQRGWLWISPSWALISGSPSTTLPAL